jgi:hypothetical protein
VVLAGTAAVAVLAVAAGVLWWETRGKEYLRELLQDAQVSLRDGRRFGGSVKHQGCLEKATSLAEACAGADLLCEVKARTFLRGCMQTTADLNVFCNALRDHDDLLARVAWAIETCQAMNRGNERCARIVGDAVDVCEKR